MRDTVRFESPLSADAVLRVVSHALETNKQRGGIRPILAGTIQGYRVSLHRQRPYARNLPVLAFDGVVTQAGSGSSIEGRYKCHDVMAPFFQAFGAVMLMAGLYAFGKGAWTPQLNLVVAGLGAAAFGGVLLFGAPRLVRSFARDDSDLLEREIRNLLSGRGV